MPRTLTPPPRRPQAPTALVQLRCEAAPAVAIARLRLRLRTHAISEADEHIAAAVAAHTDPWPQAARVRTDEHDRPVEQATRLARPHQVTADGDGSNLAPKVPLG